MVEWPIKAIFCLLFTAKRFQFIDELQCKHKLLSVKEVHIYELMKITVKSSQP